MENSALVITLFNLLLIPTLSVIIYFGYRNNIKKSVAICLKYYFIFTIIVYMGAKLLFQVFCMLFNWENIIYNFQYTFISAFVSVIVPFIYELAKKEIHFDIKIEKNEKN